MSKTAPFSVGVRSFAEIKPPARPRGLGNISQFEKTLTEIVSEGCTRFGQCILLCKHGHKPVRQIRQGVFEKVQSRPEPVGRIRQGVFLIEGDIMGKKKHSTAKSAPAEKNQKTNTNPVNKPPAWGLLVAALAAFLLCSVALTVMTKIGVQNPMVRTGIIIVIAIFAGLMARPLTFALQKRFQSTNK